MARTLNQIRRRAHERRQKPNLEQLDQRTLLSMNVEIGLPTVDLSQVQLRPHRLASAPSARPRASVPPTSRRTGSPPGGLAPQDTAARSSFEVKTTSPDPLIGASLTRSTYGVDGSGMTVAVIDTGVDYRNPALGSNYGPGAKVIAGYNFVTDTADPMATASQHGTAVAGLIGSIDPDRPGVAPGVNIVALRVVGDNNSASLKDIARALEWVIQNHETYNITAVNISLSDGGNYAQNWFARDGGVGQQVTERIGDLTRLRIPVVAATGNSFKGQQGEGFTSIVNGVISVTATDAADRLLPNAQRLGEKYGGATATDLAAPGAGLIAPWGPTGFGAVEGTSFAAPLVTGAVVLLQQIHLARAGELPTVEQVKGWLKDGSDAIFDPVTGLTIGRLDIAQAAASVPDARKTPLPAPSAPPPPIALASPEPIASPLLPAPAEPTAPDPTTSHAALPSPTLRETPSSSPPLSAEHTTGDEESRGVVDTTSREDGGAAESSRLEALFRAMTAWAGAGEGSQVRVWNANTRSSSPQRLLAASPAGSVSLRLPRPTHRGRR